MNEANGTAANTKPKSAVTQREHQLLQDVRLEKEMLNGFFRSKYSRRIFKDLKKKLFDTICR